MDNQIKPTNRASQAFWRAFAKHWHERNPATKIEVTYE